MRLVFSLTVFLSAALLFVVEPLVAKMVLPRLGGTPGVWNTCMVFFQAALLAGYAYAHWTGRWKRQPLLHPLLLLAPLAILPIAVPAGWGAGSEETPVWALLALLVTRVGLPFFVLASSGPLIQRWAARAGEKDPYWLYAASNTGSMIGLVGYPLLLEPNLPLGTQSTLWTWGYGALVLLTGACAFLVVGKDLPPAEQAADAERAPPLPVSRCLRWIALAAVPSAQMLGVTTYMTTDVASVPLLWVIPLALYLLSFILVFSSGGLSRHKLWISWVPFFVLALTELLLTGARDPLTVVLPVHLVAFLVISMVCHGELAKDRPPAAQLTAFYLLISVGGLVGGTLTSLVAPFLFGDVHEYPLALVAACALMPDRSRLAGKRKLVPLDVVLPVLLGLGTLALVHATGGKSREETTSRVVAVGIPVIVAFVFSRRPIRFALAVGAVIVATLAHRDIDRRIIHSERSFFGIHRVSNESYDEKGALSVASGSASFRALTHGSTRHGMQHVDARLEPSEPREPLTYYRRAGPLGDAIQGLVGATPGKRVGVVGLGTGTIAAYLEAGQKLVYYEIDPAVLRIAEEYFSFMKEARARGAAVSSVLGDARLTLARSTETFDVLAIDAFSSDAIPLHLVTREAIAQAYLPRLAPSGVLLFHVSNRYLDLPPILADLAGDAKLVCFARSEDLVKKDLAQGYVSATWVVLARRVADLGPLAGDRSWQPIGPRSPPIVWTDDRSDLLSAIKR